MMYSEIEVHIKAERERWGLPRKNCGGKKRREIERICGEHVAGGSQPLKRVMRS